MKRLIVILLLVFLTVAACGATLDVKDLSGGLVNSIANAKMPDNAALVLEEYTVDDFGYLTRRQGMTLLYPDALSGQQAVGLGMYYGPSGKKLLVFRHDNTHFEDSVGNNGATVLTVCDPATETCTTVVCSPLYDPFRVTAMPYNLDRSFQNNNLVIAAPKSELLFFDGTKTFPARPYEHGQPRVQAIDGGGNLTGTYRYRYAYIDTTGTTYTGQPCTSHFSTPSWPVTVRQGKVFIRVTAPVDTTRQDKVLVLRKTEDAVWVRLGSFLLHQGDSLEFIDNTAVASGGWPGIPFGVGGDWGETDDGIYLIELSDSLPLTPPGGFNIEIVNTTTVTKSIFQGHDLDSLGSPSVAYRLMYIDSAGRSTCVSPATMAAFSMSATTQCDTTMYAVLHDLPVPGDGTAIFKKVLYRKLNADLLWKVGSFNDSLWKQWYVIDTLDVDDSIYTDYIGFTELGASCGQYGEILLTPELFLPRDDSLVSFQPSAIACHGNRIYAVGDPVDPSALWYGDFGRSAFPPSHYIPISSTQGDWFVKLLSVGTDQLVAFRQNSIVQVSGLSFYQYRIEEIARDVGLTAYRSLASGVSGIFFAHTSGIRELRQKEPISLPIQNSFDSAGATLPRTWGGLVDGNYWWSSGGKTYVYVTSAPKRWECYDFGVRDAVMFDADTTQTDFRSDRYVLLLDNDSLYTWGDKTDTLDDTASIMAVYQSKFFFEGGVRVRIEQIALFGSGYVDSLRLIFYKNLDSTGAAIAFDTAIVKPDWTDERRDLVAVDEICESFSLRIEDFGRGQYALRGYSISYTPWDGGR